MKNKNWCIKPTANNKDELLKLFDKYKWSDSGGLVKFMSPLYYYLKNNNTFNNCTNISFINKPEVTIEQLRQLIQEESQTFTSNEIQYECY